MEQLLELFKEYGYTCSDESSEEHARIRITTPFGTVRVFEEGGEVSLRIGEELEDVLLNFNPATNLFEGIDVDPEVVPEPGKLPPRRSALAALVRMIMTKR